MGLMRYVVPLSLALLLGIQASGQATIACDGVDDILTLSGVSVTSNTWTIAAWITFQASPDWGVVIANDTGDRGFYSAQWIDKFHYEGSGGGTENNTAYTEGVWTHAVLVNNAGTFTFYRNGFADGSVSDSTTWTATRVCDDTSGEHLHAIVGEIRFINGIALTQNEITTLSLTSKHFVGLSRFQSAYWTFDDCTPGASAGGGTFADRSGNQLNLTASNGANGTGLTCGTSFGYPWGAN